MTLNMHISQHLILIRNQPIHFVNKRRLDLIFSQVRRFAWLSIVVHLPATPD